MKDVCIAYADKSGNGFSVSEPWIEDNFNTLEYSYSAYRKGIYSERNQQLIDGSNYCIYYSDSKTAPYTQSIIDYAIDNGIWTTNLADNLLWGADDYFEHL